MKALWLRSSMHQLFLWKRQLVEVHAPSTALQVLGFGSLPKLRLVMEMVGLH